MDNNNQNNLVNTQNHNIANIRADIAVLFAGDSYGLFIFQKTERLVQAIYLLTNLMSDREPMRERVRELANDMLESALSMSDRIWGEELFQKKLLSSITEVSLMFDIAEKTKMMSIMNHRIIATELHKLADFLVTSSSNYSSAKIALEPSTFDGNYNYVPDQTFQMPVQSQDLNNRITSNLLKDSNKGHKDTVRDNTNENKSLIKTTNTNKIIKDKNGRKEIILSMLKSGVGLTIKDFAKNINDCSEKTIQRELLSLVSQGLLKKEGERRWSKYFIIKPAENNI